MSSNKFWTRSILREIGICLGVYILLGIYFAWLDEIYAYTRVWGYIVALLGILADDEMIV
jgi:hypothetical protein